MSATRSLQLARFKQELGMHEKNVALYRATNDPRLAKTEQRITALRGHIEEIEKAAPAAPAAASTPEPEPTAP